MNKPDLTDIQSIRVYQAVKFEGKLRTFFNTKSTAQHNAISITIEKGIGVILQTEKDCVIIPFPNIGEIQLNTEYKTEKTEARIADLSKPAKAQSTSKLRKDPSSINRR